VRFDKTLVAGEQPPLPTAVDVLVELRRALAAPASWSAQAPRGQAHGVALRRLSSGGTALVLDPLGRLTVRQQVVPLNTGRDIDRFGGSPLAGVRRFTLGAAIGGAGQAVSSVQDDFAPAQFFEMSDDDKLAAPSFERMDAGIACGSEAIVFDAAEVVAAPLDYEEIIVDDLHVPSPPRQSFVLEFRSLLAFSATGAAARADVRRVGRARFRNFGDIVDRSETEDLGPPRGSDPSPSRAATTLRTPGFVVLQVAELARSPAPGITSEAEVQTFSASRDAVRLLNRAGAQFLTVPTHELQS
jgi:hypothetical protein